MARRATRRAASPGRPFSPERPSSAVALLVAALSAAGCTTETRTAASEAGAAVGVPTPVSAQVTLLAERGPYLDAAVDTRRSKLRFFFPQTDTCRQVLTGPGEATYTSTGPYGRVRRGDQYCDPVGLLSLRAWRDRRPRQTSRGGSPVPRDTARFEVIFSDEDLFMARGRFRLSALVGWPGGADTIAVFPNSEVCDGILQREIATMEYRDSGPLPLVLLHNRERCPFLGFAMTKTGA